jgi:hypothetical protein
VSISALDIFGNFKIPKSIATQNMVLAAKETFAKEKKGGLS